MVTIGRGATTIGRLQLCAMAAMGFLSLTTVIAGTILTIQGKKTPDIYFSLSVFHMCIASMGLMTTFGQQPKGEVIEDDPDDFEKKKERTSCKSSKAPYVTPLLAINVAPLFARLFCSTCIMLRAAQL